MSVDSEHIFRARIEELARTAAERNCYIFTDFLNPAEQSFVLSAERYLPVPVTCSGGWARAERVMARFGPAEEAEYEMPFPIALLRISPLNARFSDTLSHRDFLGAVMNLGIDRRFTGDILTDGTEGWLFAAEHMAPFIAENLTRVRHTVVSVSRADALPKGLVSEPEQMILITPSLRLDAVIAKAYHLSRRETDGLLAAEKIFVNSRLQKKGTCILREGDLVSVRGHGRIRYLHESGNTRKGNLRITVERY